MKIEVGNLVVMTDNLSGHLFDIGQVVEITNIITFEQLNGTYHELEGKADTSLGRTSVWYFSPSECSLIEEATNSTLVSLLQKEY